MSPTNNKSQFPSPHLEFSSYPAWYRYSSLSLHLSQVVLSQLGDGIIIKFRCRRAADDGWNKGVVEKMAPRFGVVCSCCCSSLLPGLAWAGFFVTFLSPSTFGCRFPPGISEMRKENPGSRIFCTDAFTFPDPQFSMVQNWFGNRENSRETRVKLYEKSAPADTEDRTSNHGLTLNCHQRLGGVGPLMIPQMKFLPSPSAPLATSLNFSLVTSLNIA